MLKYFVFFINKDLIVFGFYNLCFCKLYDEWYVKVFCYIIIFCVKGKKKFLCKIIFFERELCNKYIFVLIISVCILVEENVISKVKIIIKLLVIKKWFSF